MHNFVTGLIVGVVAGSFGGAFVMALMTIGAQSDALTERHQDRRRASDESNMPRLFMVNERPRSRAHRTIARHGVPSARRDALHDDNRADPYTYPEGD